MKYSSELSVSKVLAHTFTGMFRGGVNIGTTQLPKVSFRLTLAVLLTRISYGLMSLRFDSHIIRDRGEGGTLVRFLNFWPSFLHFFK